MLDLVYFSSISGNTARFVERLGMGGVRIPVSPSDPMPVTAAPFVLICPTFADGQGRGAVPKQVIKFLNIAENRALLRGVIAAGNRNFGTTFALAGDVIAQKTNAPVLYRFELAGTETDIVRIKAGLAEFRGMECSTMA